MGVKENNQGGSSENASQFIPIGSVIYAHGVPSRYLYIVKRGEVRLMRIMNNHLHVFHICRPGDILNDVSVLIKENLDHCAIARTDVELILISASDVRSVLEKCPKWVPDIFQTLCSRLLDSQEIINEHNLQAGPLEKELVLSKEEEKILMKRVTDFKS